MLTAVEGGWLGCNTGVGCVACGLGRRDCKTGAGCVACGLGRRGCKTGAGCVACGLLAGTDPLVAAVEGCG